MRKYRNWILGLGIIAAPGLAVAEASPFGREPQSVPRPAEGQANNQELADHVARTLRSAGLQGSSIDIAVDGGVVRLMGQTPDDRSKAMVSQLVGSLPGVRGVDNQLQVTRTEAPAPSPVRRAAFISPYGEPVSAIQQVEHSQPEFAPPPAPATEFIPPSAPPAESNQVMAERIGAALSSANLNGYQIQIRCLQGKVTLLGRVASPQIKMLADQTVRGVPGVTDLKNLLQVPFAGGRIPQC